MIEAAENEAGEGDYGLANYYSTYVGEYDYSCSNHFYFYEERAESDTYEQDLADCEEEGNLDPHFHKTRTLPQYNCLPGLLAWLMQNIYEYLEEGYGYGDYGHYMYTQDYNVGDKPSVYLDTPPHLSHYYYHSADEIYETYHSEHGINDAQEDSGEAAESRGIEDKEYEADAAAEGKSGATMTAELSVIALLIAVFFHGY